MNVSSKLKQFLSEHFDLTNDLENRILITENIKSNVVFKGTNLWILIFATFIASIGLNMNSTAIIIGAMLISPLMGPIVGIGLGIGIIDTDLIKKAIKNLLIAIIFSICTSTIYFYTTPLNEASSELLARTHPTIWDVFIALFGGLAGVIASTRKEKTNVVPGVAIATALMPPLCTVGYGIATLDISIVVGAFYLFLINSVFISFSTFLMIRFLKFPKVIEHEPHHKSFINRYVLISIILTVVPSIYMAYTIVKQDILSKKISAFISKEINNKYRHIIQQNVSFELDSTYVEISLIGLPLDSTKEADVKDKLKTKFSNKVKFVAFQSKDKNNLSRTINDQARIIQFQSDLINQLNQRVIILENNQYMINEINTTLDSNTLLKEAQFIDPSIIGLSINPVCNKNANIVIIKHRIQPTRTSKLDAWLKLRLNNSTLEIIHIK
jgi:uncharacterized hydrophobic protein (TIGR00271 family)